MARPFKYPAIPALAVGERVHVETPEAEGAFTRRLTKYAGRNKRAHQVVVVEGGYQVARLPDPETP